MARRASIQSRKMPAPQAPTPGARSRARRLRDVLRQAVLAPISAKTPGRIKLVACVFLALLRDYRRQADLFRPASGARRRRQARRRRRHRGGAARHPRPQWRDSRDRHQGDVGLRRAAPHHRQGRSGRTSDRRAARRRRAAICASGSARARASSGSSARSRRSSRRRSFASACPASASCPRTSASIRTARSRAHVLGFANLDNEGIAGIEKYIDGQGLADLHGAGLQPDAGKSRRRSRFARPQGDLRRARRTRQGHRASSRRRPAPPPSSTSIPARSSRMASLPDFDPNKPADALRSRPYQPHDGRRLRDGLDLQGDVARDGARCRQGQPQFAGRRARLAALRPLHHPRFPRPASHADRAGGVHLFLEHRRGAHGADGRRRRAQGVSAQDGPT